MMDACHSTMLALVKIAEKGGRISPIELAFLDEVTQPLVGEDLDDLLVESRDHPLEALLEGVASYEDRFFVAMRAFHLAHADDEYEFNELLSVNKLMIRFGISPEDRMLIEETDLERSLEELCAEHPRIAELYRGSSLCVR